MRQDDSTHEIRDLRPFAPSRDISATALSVEQISAIVVDCGYHLHVDVGPGLLESVYEVLLAKLLADRGLKVERQVPVPIQLHGISFHEGFRTDLLVQDRLPIELKSVDTIAPIHVKQTATYLRLLKLPLALLINFGAATFKEGVRRVVNRHMETAGSKLAIHQPPVDL